MFKGFVYHTFKGIPVRSPKALDVSCIEHMSSKKRIFKIFNRDYPYNLRIVYNKPKESAGISFGIFPSVYNRVDIHQELTLRYKTREEIESDIQDVNNKKQELNNMKNRLIKLLNNNVFKSEVPEPKS